MVIPSTTKKTKRRKRRRRTRTQNLKLDVKRLVRKITGNLSKR